MADEERDLWPKDIGAGNLVTPVAILREQAALLGQKTQQLVTAEVTTQTRQEKFAHSFHLVAPALDNYKYEIFSVHHGITFYPMQVVYQGTAHQVGSQDAFLNFLRTIFTSTATKNIIQSLIAQMQS
jgi:hypothetical protein